MVHQSDIKIAGNTASAGSLWKMFNGVEIKLKCLLSLVIDVDMYTNGFCKLK